MKTKLQEIGLTVEDVSIGVHRRNLWGRNEPCPCKSGKKYKKCCQDKLEVTYVANLQPQVIEIGKVRLNAQKVVDSIVSGELVKVHSDGKNSESIEKFPESNGDASV